MAVVVVVVIVVVIATTTTFPLSSLTLITEENLNPF